VIWVASIGICDEDGVWFDRMTYHSSRLAVWEWLLSTMVQCAKSGQKFDNPLIMRKRKSHIDPDQFSWCQGEECARDWQDPPLVRGRKP